MYQGPGRNLAVEDNETGSATSTRWMVSEANRHGFDGNVRCGRDYEKCVEVPGTVT